MKSAAGVVAIQGDFEKHIEAFAKVGVPDAREIRTPEDLAGVDRLVIPGGESTTVGKLMDRYGLGAAIQERAIAGMPVWGTCMGMILMARSVEGTEQYSLGLLGIEVRRNAFGAQVHSFEDEVVFKGFDSPVTAVFIRAPIVTKMDAGVEQLASYQGNLVAVRQENRIGTSFHPELTDDVRLHKWFLRVR